MEARLFSLCSCKTKRSEYVRKFPINFHPSHVPGTFLYHKLENRTCISKVNRTGVVFLIIRSNLSATATLETEEGGRYGEVSVGVKHDTDIFMGFTEQFCRKKCSL